MDYFDFTLKNYRPFSIDNPVTFRFQKGVTIVLGPNNVGKSALLRSIIELRPVAAALMTIGNTKLSMADFARMQHRKCRAMPMTIEFSNARMTLRVTLHQGSSPASVSASYERLGDFDQALIDLVKEVFVQSLYIGPHRSAVASSSGSAGDIATGGGFVGELRGWKDGGDLDRQEAIQELERELADLLGFRSFSITFSENKNSINISNDDGNFTLEELGTGISHYLLVLANSLIRRPAFVLIDEPEVGLHPKLQEQFMRALEVKTKYGVIAASHSVALARCSASTLLSLTRASSGKRTLAPYQDITNATLSQIVFEMGYSLCAEIGGNHLLLVEGLTDVKSFRELLRKFNLEQHFLVWSLGGSERIKRQKADVIAELMELKRIGARSYTVIIDSETTSADGHPAKEASEFEEACREAGFNVFLTEGHSTENYITDRAVKSLRPECSALGLYENRNTAPPAKKWPKSENWRMFAAMNVADLKGTKLLTFFEDVLRKAVEERQVELSAS